MPLSNFPNGVSSFGVPVLGSVAGLPMTGTFWFVNPSSGNDGNDGKSPQSALATLYQAHNLATAGNNDVVVLIGNGASSGSAILSTALAQTINSSATSGTLNWTKNATHLVGVAAPTQTPMARIAPPTGTYTQTTFGSGNFVVVTATGCLFQNLNVVQSFSTGDNNQICWTDNGSSNSYINVNFFGAGDAASAASTSSRSLKIGGNGGLNFERCKVGGDSTVRSVANSALEFAGGTARNIFTDCLFPVNASAAGVLSVLGTGAACIAAYQNFNRCQFVNQMGSGATAQTVIMSMTNASPGGLVLLDNCTFVGNASTNWGDTNALAIQYVMGASPTAATNGIAVNPT